MPLDYDSEVGIGWGPLKLSDRHPFYRNAVVHDAWYDDIIAGTATKTLKEVDREFLRNCLRVAWGYRSWILMKEAWFFYRLCRFWAKNFRPELESFRPKRRYD